MLSSINVVVGLLAALMLSAAAVPSPPVDDERIRYAVDRNSLELVGRYAGVYGEPSEDAPTDGVLDANDPEVYQYAYHFGVSLERSTELANWMVAAGPYVASMEQKLEGNFASARLIHGSTNGASTSDPDLDPGVLRLEVRLADPDDPAAVEYIAGIQRMTDVSVDVAKVPLPLTELLAMAAELDLGPGEIADFDVETGKVFKVPNEPGDPNSCPMSSVQNGTLDGARPIRVYNEDCGANTWGGGTTGYPAKMGNFYGVVTAGHGLSGRFLHIGIGADLPANANGFTTNGPWRSDVMYAYNNTVIYLSANSHWYVDNNNHDIGFVRRRYNNTTYPGRIWKWDTQEWRNIEQYEFSPHNDGWPICASASSYADAGPGTYCGLVEDRYYNPNTNPGQTNWTQVDAFEAPLGIASAPGPGASGSPVFYGPTVYGMYTHGTGAGGRYWSFIRAQAIQSRMAQAQAAVGGTVSMICYNADPCVPE